MSSLYFPGLNLAIDISGVIHGKSVEAWGLEFKAGWKPLLQPVIEAESIEMGLSDKPRRRLGDCRLRAKGRGRMTRVGKSPPS